MLKRIIVLVFVISALAVLAMAPAGTQDAPKFQSTEAPTDAPTADVGVTIVVGTPEGTPGTIPATGGGGMPMSTMLIFGLVAILGVAVVIGGMALLSRRQ